MESKRVAVIGAGPSGVAQLRGFKLSANQGKKIPEVVCFEKQADAGGLWNLTWRVGIDENGEPVHTSMYKHLCSNGPKEALEFPDYSFEEHFGKCIPSFPPRPVLLDYIKAYFTKFQIENWIRFSTVVRDVKFDNQTKKFTVKVHDYKANKTYSEEFDYVVNASGHYHTPNYPEFPGFPDFEGEILHSHDYRDARIYKGKNLLVIGRSYSAEDIASQCYKFGAKNIYISWRSAPLGFKWPEGVKEVPLLQKVDKKTAYFKDGTTAEVDVIILCTGFRHHYPHFHEDIRLDSPNCLWLDQLYKGVVWKKNPQCFYLGAQDQFFTFNMFGTQAWYVRDIILGDIKVPDTIEEMDKRDKYFMEQVHKLKTPIDMINFQGDHIIDLLKETDYNRDKFDVEGMKKAFFDWEEDKVENIMTFRDKTFKSLITGNMQAEPYLPWLKDFTQTTEEYLALGKNNSK